MGDRAKFSIATLADMAEIPEDRVDRFLAELPAILRTTRELNEAVPALAERAKAEARWPIRLFPLSIFEAALRHSLAGKSGSLIWVDDDKGLATVSVRWNSESGAFFSQTETMR